MHAFLLRHPIPLVILFIIATWLLSNINNKITSETQIRPVQFFSVEKFATPKPINPVHFNQVLDKLTNKIDKSVFHRFFYIDFCWALLLLCNIYVFTCRLKGTQTPIRWLIAILSLAYCFDVLENLSYLTASPRLVQHLEYTNQAKLLFYALGVGSLLYAIIYRGTQKLKIN